MTAPRYRRYRQSRRGVVVAMALVVFAVLLALAGVWARGSLAEARRARLEEERSQAAWLAEAGVRRGAVRRLADADYTGETWTIGADELSRRDAASVEISLQPIGERPEAVRIVARAAYPEKNPRVRITKRVELNLPSSGE